jgi:RecB family exonuclease
LWFVWFAMKERAQELIVFPTELAMRRFQQELALEQGFVDASCHITFARLRKLCLPYASLKQAQLQGAREQLMLRQVVEVALGHFSKKGTLGRLSPSALNDVLERLIAELSILPGETAKIIDWLLDHHRTHKLYELGTLFSVWRAIIKQEGYADRLDVNQSILRLLRGSRDNWPPLLRDTDRITFRAVRWFNPFEEVCVLALNHKLKVGIESALPPAHAEAAADRMGQRIRAEIMDQPWAVWAEDLGDALAVESPDLLEPADSARINFSRSSGAYGEIEDLARRICWNLEKGNMPPNRIALVVPDMGAVQDIIPHVFSRFEIPYFFRRGRPVLSSPCVKAFLGWLSFPLHPERDVLIDLIRNPALHVANREEGVKDLFRKKTPPLVNPESLPWFRGRSECSGRQAALLLEEHVVEPDDHFNSEALKAVTATLDDIGEQVLPLVDLVDLLEGLLEDATVKPRDSHDQGVWVLNPHDAVGLDFDLILFAGLNEGEFPSSPQQDALLSDTERYRLRQHLVEQGAPLPTMAMPDASVRCAQESVLFLCAMGMAREQVVFSYQASDQEGNEKSEGEYYRKLWNLAGWSAQDTFLLSPYDEWRIAILDRNNMFADHVQKQRATDRTDRVPMPGESFLAFVPPPLCRAADEMLQSAVQEELKDCESIDVPETSRRLPIDHLVSMLDIESERAQFLNTPINERGKSVYCGQIGTATERIANWLEERREISPTALETLTHCRYIFLLDKVFGLDEQREMSDTPDPMDRGTLIHSILKEIYSAIANGESGIDVPRYWSVKTAAGWRLRTEEGIDAIPLATFVSARKDEYESYARQVTSERLRKAKLGHPGVWAAEREKVLEQVLNFVRHDVDTCESENRYPALFEFGFSGDTALDLGDVKLRGTIDRIDLVFAENGELQKIRVLDYKGSSRVRSKAEEYRDEIRLNLDCQLPTYALAAQQHFFGEFNSEAVNAMTESGYLFYQRELKEVAKTSKKSLVSLDEPELVSGFMSTLIENLRRLRAGDFAVDPLIKAYADYASICRTEAVNREDLE